MEQQLRSLVTTRDALEELDNVLTCIGVAVTARPLSERESDGVAAILRWSAGRLGNCSQELGTLIEHACNACEI